MKHLIAIACVVLGIGLLVVGGVRFYKVAAPPPAPVEVPPKPPPTESAHQMRLRLKWKHQGQFAGFYVAKEQGLYAKRGLDVRLDPGGPDTNAISLVLTGQADIGIWGAEQVLAHQIAGKPIVAIGVVYQRTAACWVVRDDSDIRGFNDFVGKRVGVQKDTDLDLLYSTLAARTGLDRSKVSETRVGFNFGQFLNKEFDVWPSYAVNEPFVAQREGVAIRVLQPHELGLDFYGDTLFTTTELLTRSPERVRDFLAASVEGWTLALQQPNEAARITCLQEPVLQTDHQQFMITESIRLIRPDPKQPLFKMTAERWNTIAQALAATGQIPTTASGKDVFTNDYLPE